MCELKYTVSNIFGVVECEVLEEDDAHAVIKTKFKDKLKISKESLSKTKDEAIIKFYKENMKEERDNIKRLKNKVLRAENDYNEKLKKFGIQELLEKYPDKFF